MNAEEALRAAVRKVHPTLCIGTERHGAFVYPGRQVRLDVFGTLQTSVTISPNFDIDQIDATMRALVLARDIMTEIERIRNDNPMS